MDPRDLATALVSRRLDTLRALGRQAVAARAKPVINVTVVVPPEAIRVEFPPIPPAQEAQESPETTQPAP